MGQPSGMPAARTNHFVLNGSDDLTYRLAQQLSERYRAEVVVLMTEAEQAAARDFTDLDRVALGPRTSTGSPSSPPGTG
jgi:hypothetical protein